MTTAFGKIVIASQVEYMVRDTLQQWFPTYLREVERQVGWERDSLPAPRNYTNRNAFDALVGEEMPKVVVISPGLWEVPRIKEGDGYYSAIWQVGVGVATAAPTEEVADRMCKMYAAAVRAILIQHQSLNGEAAGVYWLDENYDDLPINDQHANYKAAGEFFGVEVAEVTSRFMRPPLVSEETQEIDEVDQVIISIPEYDKESVTP